MLVLIIIVNIAALSTGARTGMATYVHLLFTSVPTDRITSLLPDLTILVFVIAAEVWSWIQRIMSALQTRRLTSRLTADHSHLAEYMGQFFDQQFKAINYLMIAHAAALLATVTLIKDFLASLKNSTAPVEFAVIAPKDIGSFIAFFAWGLVLAIMGYITLFIARENVMSAIQFNSRQTLDQKSSYLAWLFCTGSALLLLAGILTVAARATGMQSPL